MPGGSVFLKINPASGAGLIDVVSVGNDGNTNGELALLPTSQSLYKTNIGQTTNRFNNAYLSNITSYSASVTTATVRTLLPDQSNGLLNPTIGTPTQKFDTIYATNVVADSVSLTGLAVPVYANDAARNAAYTGTPGTGVLILNGTKFQGYNGTAWVDLN